ncbi:MAG: tetratricopeptide repeat protein [Mariprofundales bacterium]|nr:tetratricopeptide repeat protein [Mariprofundales bacterium]
MPDNWPGVGAGLSQVVELLQNNQLDAAQSLLDELSNFATADARLWYLLGKLAQKQGDDKQAKEHYRRAKRLQQHEDSATISSTPGSMRIAKLLHSQGDLAQALAMVEELLSSRPNDLRLSRLRNRWQAEQTPS